MSKNIFCVMEQSFHYVAAESKEDALKVLGKEDPLHTFDEGYGEIKMLSRSEAEEMGLEAFCEEDTPSDSEEVKESELGKCPVCHRRGRLEYDGRAVIEGDHVYYNFTCPDCEATGKEWHRIIFDSIEADQKEDSHAQ